MVRRGERLNPSLTVTFMIWKTFRNVWKKRLCGAGRCALSSTAVMPLDWMHRYVQPYISVSLIFGPYMTLIRIQSRFFLCSLLLETRENFFKRLLFSREKTDHFQFLQGLTRFGGFKRILPSFPPQSLYSTSTTRRRPPGYF